jgi:hypothetical protein
MSFRRTKLTTLRHKAIKQVWFVNFTVFERQSNSFEFSGAKRLRILLNENWKFQRSTYE